jgi:hypothetical protein
MAAYATGDSPTAIPVFGSNGFMVPSTAAQVVAAIGAIPITSIGSAGLSGTSPIVVASTGAISCPTCSTGGGSVISTVACSTSGNAFFQEPIQGLNDKKVLIRLAACLGTASYTYPTAFTNTPDYFIGGAASGASVSSVSTTAVTVTGATNTGNITLESY